MWIVLIIALLPSSSLADDCKPSQTTASGTHVPKGVICSGQLIFEENFNDLNLETWQHERTLGGGGNWEFQWYTHNKTNSYVDNGIFHIKPTLVADQFGNDFLYSGTVEVEGCTNAGWFGCKRSGSASNILNPIKSARINSQGFAFKYGKVEIRAKLPSGDWLWPGIWMLPRENKYSNWPRSGEIDIMESRGNQNLVKNGVNIGVQQIGSTLHWGPDGNNDKYAYTAFLHNNDAGYDKDFHNYQLEWTPEKLSFAVDGTHIGTVTAPQGGFWELGQLAPSGLDNPWKDQPKIAPFNEEFYFIINLAVGGTNYYFPEDATNSPGGKPWKNQSPAAMKEFWEGKQQWLPTWDMVGDKSHLQVDYVKVWAL